MPRVILTGFLICRTLDEADRVAGMVADHVRQSRAEEGCIAFEIIRSMADPVRFAVREIYQTRAAFQAHLDRVRSTPWGQSTRGLHRDYMLTDAAGQRHFTPPRDLPAERKDQGGQSGNGHGGNGQGG